MIPIQRATSSAEMAGNAQEPSSNAQEAPATAARAGQKRKAEGEPGERSPSSPTPNARTSPTSAGQQRASASQTPRVGTVSASLSIPIGQREAQALEGEADDEGETQEPVQTRPQPRSRPPPELMQSESTENRRVVEMAAHSSNMLPAGQVFPIQIGSDIFRLSGASISSDAPSYFSHYFGEQLIRAGGRASEVKTLYLDRDPATFKDIALHLQGYYVKPRDGDHFVRLFADAQFYSLPRLTQQLFKSEIFIQVGGRHFQIPRDIFSSPGDSPNFFSLGFAHFFSTPAEVFPGLDRQTLLRPPSILPPSVPNRSADVFADLLRLLQGYDVKIRDADHRAELLRDARYFHLRGVEQKLLPYEMLRNVLSGRSEIVIRIEDVRPSGVGLLVDKRSRSWESAPQGTSSMSIANTAEPPNCLPMGRITYKRPYIDDSARDLILDISPSDDTTLNLASMQASFGGPIKLRVASLFTHIATRLNLHIMVPRGLTVPTTGDDTAAQPGSSTNSDPSPFKVKIRVDRDASVTLDGVVVEWDGRDGQMSDGDLPAAMPRIRKWMVDRTLNKETEWLIQRAQWRLRIEPVAESHSGGNQVELVLCAVKLEGFTSMMFRNQSRGFLG